MSTPIQRHTMVDGKSVLTYEGWYLGYTMDPTNGPALRRWLLRSGYTMHRTDGPALRRWEIVNGQSVLTYEGWVVDGRLHRTDGPAIQQWQIVNDQPVLMYQAWYCNNRLHRVDAPAIQQWQLVKGQRVLTYEAWYSKGDYCCRRMNGPISAVTCAYEARQNSTTADGVAKIIQRWYRDRKSV